MSSEPGLGIYFFLASPRSGLIAYEPLPLRGLVVVVFEN